MKKLIALFFMIISLCGFSQSDKPIGLPGDNLNLYATLKLFQECKTLEIFENKLNDKLYHINNLDLNGDNKIDYIKVIDQKDGNTHYITLCDELSDNEKQDIAFIIIQRESDIVHIQLVGNEDLYGKDYIIEPNLVERDGETPNPGYKDATYYTTYDIANLEIINYLYSPLYTSWCSVYHWDCYPYYWYGWSPFSWNNYHKWHSNYTNFYYGHYRHSTHVRYKEYSTYYKYRRNTSSVYKSRLDRNMYKNTYSKRYNRNSYTPRTKNPTYTIPRTTPGRNGNTINRGRGR